MRRAVTMMIMAPILMPGLSMGQSAFNGTWRPDPQRPGPSEKSIVVELFDGQYECKSCTPPYKIKADGHDQTVSGVPYYDTLSVTVADERTVLKTAKKGGHTVAEIKDAVSADGGSMIETQTVVGVASRPFEFAKKLSRAAAGPLRAHLISGEWRLVEADLTHHEEDTTYTISGDVLTMSDQFGRAFSAKLDGTKAPYRGDPEFTDVSLKLIDSRTIEESDWNAGKVLKISTWTVHPDGKTIHVRFDDTKGHIQEQDGHRLP